MKVVPGDALLHIVHGAAGRTRHPQIVAQTPHPPQDAARPGSARSVERPLPQQPGRPMPRGSALDVTV